jgi:metal transporter CNNM
MVVNETLPVIADPVLNGGFQSVVVSTALIVMCVPFSFLSTLVPCESAKYSRAFGIRFSEIIPQSLFTRHGLYLGAKMAGFTKVLIYGLVSFFRLTRPGVAHLVPVLGLYFLARR